MNMAGDFENIDAAWDFASAGGIPITGIISGGKVSAIRMQHVWVEAAVPYYPARGAKPASVRNPIDAWVPIDTSFKQYDYLQGLDTQAIVNINGEQLANNFINSGTVNEQEGWVQGLNSNIIAAAQEQAQQKLEAHINQMQNPTVGDVIGGRKIIKQSYNVLPSSLPYQKTAKGNTFAQLPANLQVRVNLGLGWDRYDQSYLQSKTMPLYQLNQRSITISFKPASTADENALRALIPENLTDPSQLPSFLPSSIRVIPEIKRDNEVLLTSNALALGEEIDMGYQFITPTQNYLNRRDSIIAGSYLALGIVGSNPSKKVFEKLEVQMVNTRDSLKRRSPQELKEISRDRIIGDMFISGINGYYAQHGIMMSAYGLSARINSRLLPSAGTYGYEPRQQSFFGLNRGIGSGGAYMNVRMASIGESFDGDKQIKVAFNELSGLFSSHLEWLIPEEQFGGLKEIQNGKSFSATKIISKAMADGQKIYSINQRNKQALNQIRIDPLAFTEISSALLSGKEIIAHEAPLRFGAWSGSGYIIYDPITGDGAYKISGGINGGGNAEEVGDVMSFVFALTENPGLIVPVCYGTFFERAINNFFETNKAIWGLAAPPGITLITGAAVAEAAGGYTILTAIKLSIKTPAGMLGYFKTAIMMSLLNWLLVALVWEVGVAIGSVISAAACREE